MKNQAAQNALHATTSMAAMVKAPLKFIYLDNVLIFLQPR